MRTQMWTLAAIVAASVCATPAYANDGIVQELFDSAPTDTTDLTKVSLAIGEKLKAMGKESIKMFQFKCGHAKAPEGTDGDIGPKTRNCIKIVAQHVVDVNKREQKHADALKACEAEIADLKAKNEALEAENARLRASGGGATSDNCEPVTVDPKGPCAGVDEYTFAAGTCDPVSQMLRCETDPSEPTKPRYVVVNKCILEQEFRESGGGKKYRKDGTLVNAQMQVVTRATVPSGYLRCPAIPGPPPPEPPTWMDRNWGWLVLGGLATVGAGVAIVGVAGGFDPGNVYVGGRPAGGGQ